MSDFKDSQEAAYRRLVRGAVRKGGFSKSERDVVLAIVNHWFHHKAKGKMHPSRERIAKKADVSVRTVATVLALLRDTGVLVPQSKARRGKGRPAEYSVDDLSLMQLCGVDMAKIVAAMSGGKSAKLHTKDGNLSVQKLHTDKYSVATPIQEGRFENSNVVPLPKVVGGGNV